MNTPTAFIPQPPERLRLSILASAALVATGCASTTRGSVTTGGRSRSQLLLVSSAEVMQDSLRYYDEQNHKARQKGTLISNGPQWRRVNAIMQRLVPHVASFRPDAARWPWQLVLLKDDSVNAYVMAGGKITFYTGLIDKLHLSDDEIAAVMGHEMAHALREHTREKMSQNMAGDLAISIGSAILGGGQTTSQMAGLGKQLALDLPFSRQMETEADLYGLELAARAGYKPEAAVTLWQKMARMGGQQGPAFLSTHPNSNERMAALRAAVPRVQPLYDEARRRG